MRKALLLLFCTLFVGHHGQSQNDSLRKPYLILNTEMHTATIRAVDTDAKGKYILTCSDDKTAKLWSAEGDLLKTFRVPINSGEEGELYACAISPDGKMVALGGWTTSSTKKGFSVYIYNAFSEEISVTIKNLPGTIHALKFSPDAKYLVLALSINTGIRVFKTKSWEYQKIDNEYDRVISDMAFSKDGRLATASEDGYIRLYDRNFNLTWKRNTETGKKPNSISFQPGGSKLVITYSDSPLLEILDAYNLQTIAIKDFLDSSNSFNAAIFSQDGKALIAGGFVLKKDSATGYPSNVIQRYFESGDTSFLEYSDVGFRSITEIAPLPSNKLILIFDPPAIYSISESFDFYQFYKPSEIFSFFHIRPELSVDSLGQQLNYLLERPHYVNISFSLAERKVLITDSITFSFNKINFEIDSTIAQFIKDESDLQDIEISNTGHIWYGNTWNLYHLNTSGEEQWHTNLIESACATKISKNHKTALIAHRDGIFRWYALKDGKHLLSLYIHPENHKWVLWTPSGFYDCAAGAEDLIGWYLNQNRGQGVYYPASHFRKTYYRPDIIDQVLETYDELEAIRKADSLSGRPTSKITFAKNLPPTIRITNLQDGQEVDEVWQNIDYEATSPNGKPITEIEIRVNGRPDAFGFKNVSDKKDSIISGNREVLIPREDCTISVIARNSNGNSAATVKLKWAGLSQIEADKPTLYVLAIGVKNYEKSDYNLKWADKDASDLVEALEKQKGDLYKDVQIRLLQNDEATTTNILESLDWLKKKPTSRDVTIIFFSGHGDNDNIGNFYFMPHNADRNRLNTTCISGTQIKNITKGMAGKVILFTDACHSGSNGKAVNIRGLINELSDAENGVIVFNSSAARQLSQELDDKKNGAFTEALLEGLAGMADRSGNNNDVVHVRELESFLITRVHKLTNGRQSPPSLPKDIPDFPLAVILP